jgi:ribosomal protein S8
MKLKLRIFDGKKGKYNELVLKVLYKNGYLTAYKIAKEIARFQIKPKENLRLKALSVQSPLIRSNGRLAELGKKEYIQKTEKGFCSRSLKTRVYS